MYELNPEFWSKAVFMAELLTAEALMTTGLKRRPYFALRLLASLVLLFGLSLAFPNIDGALYASFLFIALFALTLIGMRACFDESFRTILFCGLAGYATQHIAYEIFDMSMVLMGLGNQTGGELYVGSNPLASFVTFVGGSGAPRVGNAFIYIIYAAAYVLTYWTVFRIVSPRMRDIGNLQLKNSTALAVIAMTVAFDIVISAFVSEYGSRDFNKTYIFLLDLTNIFCCTLALYQQFSLAKMRRISDDLETVNHMLEQSKHQYALTKQSIDLINMKCHDLKHQVRSIGKTNAISPVAVGELEKAITFYDTVVKTGNAALDIILTEKSVFCNRHDISLSCVADGKQLNFMAEPDLYSLFGNILDNAIEAVAYLPPEKKAVGLSVKRVNGFVFVNVNNYYGGKLVFENDLPVTTKSGAFHGYGIKSAKMLAERYGGNLKINAGNGIFNLDLLFPSAGNET